MTNEDQCAWLDWAVEKDLLYLDYYPDQYKHQKTGNTAAWLEKSGVLLNECDLIDIIYHEIDKRGWLLTQQDVAQWDRERQSFVIKHDCYIHYVDIQTSKFIGEAHEAESRLDALMEAFRESVEAN